jgi:hypothetical protein
VRVVYFLALQFVERNLATTKSVGRIHLEASALKFERGMKQLRRQDKLECATKPQFEPPSCGAIVDGDFEQAAGADQGDESSLGHGLVMRGKRND